MIIRSKDKTRIFTLNDRNLTLNISSRASGKYVISNSDLYDLDSFDTEEEAIAALDKIFMGIKNREEVVDLAEEKNKTNPQGVKMVDNSFIQGTCMLCGKRCDPYDETAVKRGERLIKNNSFKDF